MGRIGPLFCWMLVMTLMIASGTAEAQTLQKLVMPGPLSAPHAKLEGNCNQCHAPFSKETQNSLCLTCHKDIDADIKAKSGFHGRSATVAGVECKSCHTDHKGRSFDIVGLNRESFDHNATDFPLTGAHGKANCTQCHAAGTKFREASKDCVACHESDDVHKGSMGANCAQCHTTASWSVSDFDHSKTRFPLVGKHATVDCAACHPNRAYKGTPTDCAACHVVDDAHGGRFGTKCESCHTPAAWKSVTFDHARDAKFPLRGAHAGLACNTCHVSPKANAKLPTTCAECHAIQDVHKGRNGPKCESCHNETSWKAVSFDHDKDTKFPLRGAHSHLQCTDCHHGNPREEKLATTCFACHATDDPHKKQLGEACGTCHGIVSWSKDVRFDHDLTNFPLLGLHAAVACESCHVTLAFKDAKAGCIDCHRADDVHKGTLGENCAQCHNPNGWDRWQFDHATQTDFPLTGSHKDLACKECHHEPVYRKSSQTAACYACHAKDDEHAGQFGRRCEQCHQTDSFKNIRIRR